MRGVPTDERTPGWNKAGACVCVWKSLEFIIYHPSFIPLFSTGKAMGAGVRGAYAERNRETYECDEDEVEPELLMRDL